MNKIVKTSNTGGFPLLNDDIRFLQDEVIGHVEHTLCEMSGNILWGMGYVESGGNILTFNGAMSYANKIYTVTNYLNEVGIIDDIYLVDDITYDSAGDRTFKDGTVTYDIYEIAGCKYVNTAGSGVPVGYAWYVKLVDMNPASKNIASQLSSPPYSGYEIYKEWIDNLFGTDEESAYTFDTLLANDIRTNYANDLLFQNSSRVQNAIDHILADDTLRNYLIDNMLVNAVNQERLFNKIRTTIAATGTWLNGWADAVGFDGLKIRKDADGTVTLFGGFQSGTIVDVNDPVIWDNLSATYLPASDVHGAVFRRDSTDIETLKAKVTSSGNFEVINASSNSQYSINLTWKV